MARNDGKKNKQKAKRMIVKELSGVTKPAHEGAEVTLFKMDESDIEKHQKGVLSTEVEGHQHGLFLHEFEDPMSGELETYEDKAGTLTYTHEHTHVYVTNDDGTISVGAAYGHTHEIDATMDEVMEKVYGTELPDINPGDPGHSSTAKGATQMDTKSSTSDFEKKIEDLTMELAKTKVLASLTDAQKAHVSTLDEALQSVFMDKSSTAKDAEIDMLKAADPVVYTATDGTEFKKSDDSQMVSAIKRADALESRLDAQIEKGEMQELEKQAKETLGNLPGELETQVALLKAVESISDVEIKKNAHAALLAANASLAKAFQTVGTSEGEALNATEKLDALAKTYAEKNNVTFAKAFSEVVETAEGVELYNATVNS